jgi:acyl-CoA thioesterase II
MADPATAPTRPGPTGQVAVDGLVALLDLEPIELDIYRGTSQQGRSQRVFGGQVAGQALIAAGRSVDPDRYVHSLHSYFIRPGDPSVPILYEVDRVRDGRSFSTRRVVAVQRGDAIFTLSASFQLMQDGIEHQTAMPDAPDPDSLPRFEDRCRADPRAERWFLGQPRPIDLRYVDAAPWEREEVGPNDGPFRVWLRADGTLPDDPLLHVCVLTFASDMTLLDAALARQGLANKLGGELIMASLDHAMWFERPFRADEWLLYTMQSPSATGGRALASGRFHRRDGTMVASVVQEGLVRQRS